jgi:uncharacterized FlaG/YvyC family protein
MTEPVRPTGFAAAVALRPADLDHGARQGGIRAITAEAVRAPDEKQPADARAREDQTEAARQLLERLDAARAAAQSKLRIERNDETGEFIYKTIDRETGEVIEQWPEEKVLNMLSFLGEMKGLVVDEES